MALNGTDTVDTQSNALTLSGTLSGTGSLSKIGAGTLTLTDNNTYTGGTALEPAQDEYHLVVCDLDVANRVQAWASMKSFVAKDGSGEPPSPGRNGERHFHGEQRSNETHSSTTDPEAKLAKKGKGKEAKLAYTGHVMTENRNGFVVEAELRQVSGTVERETAKDMTCAIRHAGLQRYTARGPKHDQSPFRHRWSAALHLTADVSIRGPAELRDCLAPRCFLPTPWHFYICPAIGGYRFPFTSSTHCSQLIEKAARTLNENPK